MDDTQISRRRMFAVGAGGAAAIGGAAVSGAGAALLGQARRLPSAGESKDVCFIMPDVVDGPYYVPKAIMRSDITEGKQGIPLEVRVRLVDAACRPIAGARVDTWQADAQGIYSGFKLQGDDFKTQTLEATYLRGTQVSDADGLVVFTSIYPGWYRGRTPHIHFKIYVDGRTRLTCQLYFPDGLSEFIYTRVPGYVRPATRDTINATDWILAEGTRHSVAQLKEETDRYVASITYGVNPLATPAPSEKMPCPPAPALCVPAAGTPPVGPERITWLVPSKQALARPSAQKPPLPKGAEG